MGLFYSHAGTCKSADCSNNYTTRHTAHLKKDTLQKGIFFVIYLGEFSRVNFHTRAHGGSQGDAL